MSERALLIGIELPNQYYKTEYTLHELARLAEAAGYEVVEQIYQKVTTPNPRFYIGAGKVEEIKAKIETESFDILLFDDELSPSQVKNLEDTLQITIIDRSLLIINIFQKRAKTTSAILEVELARLRYLLPRLVGMNESLSRQGGASGGKSSKGAGETQLELERRKIHQEINTLEKKLANYNQTKQVQKSRRNKTNIPIIGFVGYTNSGKSSTFNAILKHCKESSNKETLAQDLLFATVDTCVRSVTFPNNQRAILIDTVGFVSKLPTLLINSFKSTLEEVLDASLLLHLVDIHSEYYQNQIQITNDVLVQIGAKNIPTLYILNKCDLATPPSFFLEGEHIYHSNKNEQMIANLVENIQDKLKETYNTKITLKIPIADGKTISLVEEYGIIEAKFVNNDYLLYTCYFPTNRLIQVRQYRYN